MDELRSGSPGSPGSDTALAGCMAVWENRIAVPPYLLGVLDRGEASVIALALENRWPEVAIDESVGRSVAKTSGLRLTGSLGLLIRAKRAGCPIVVAGAISRLRGAGIWIGADVVRAALHAAGENAE
jgi:predicted nucleic acid-binding protein